MTQITREENAKGFVQGFEVGGGYSVCFIKAENWEEKIIKGSNETLMMNQTEGY